MKNIIIIIFIVFIFFFVGHVKDIKQKHCECPAHTLNTKAKGALKLWKSL